MTKYFAELNDSNKVLRVIVAYNLQWCENNLGGKWVEAFKDRSERANFPGTGWFYDEDLDIFHDEKPYASWVLDVENGVWKAPLPYPVGGLEYSWSEEDQAWVLVNSLVE